MLRVMAATADEDVIAAAVLHDVIEDCGVEVQEIETRFGAPVAALVEMLTNESKGLFAHRSDRKKADLNRISDASRDVRLVKLADRLDNVRDLGGAPPKFVELYLAESEALLALLWGRTDEAIEEELGKAIEEARAKL
jgi:(p)ppGpp synthase/HD superfamily hydrolase